MPKNQATAIPKKIPPVGFLLLLCCLCVSLLWNTFRSAVTPEPLPAIPTKQSAKTEKVVYTVLGDSIAAGYALPDYQKDSVLPEKSFAALWGKEIGAQKIYPMAVTGSDTKDTLKLLAQDHYRQAIQNATVITVSLGSNDLLGPGLGQIKSFLGVESTEALNRQLQLFRLDKNALKQVLSLLSKEIKAKENQKLLWKKEKQYEEQFTKCLETVRTLNPTASLYIMNYYNPYRDFTDSSKAENPVDFGDSVQAYLDRMNTFLADFCSRKSNVFLVDISGMSQNFTNVSLEAGSFSFSADPHPNEKGHAYILDCLKKAAEKK